MKTENFNRIPHNFANLLAGMSAAQSTVLCVLFLISGLALHGIFLLSFAEGQTAKFDAGTLSTYANHLKTVFLCSSGSILILFFSLAGLAVFGVSKSSA
jgi:hypothetical protein